MKIFIGPVTKNVVDTVIEFATDDKPVALIPSRRQIEYSGGYVNNWTTAEFCSYVRGKTTSVVLQRNHAGPWQGQTRDYGFTSLREDCQHFDLIHIDPWKLYPGIQDGIRETIALIKYCQRINKNIRYEIGTEESIRPLDVNAMESLISELSRSLTANEFRSIAYLAIQSGTALKGTVQMGSHDPTKLVDMVALANKYNLLTKEHNGDYLPTDIIFEKFSLGLDAINIAPEFGLIETQTYLDHMDQESFDQFWQICYDSRKWQKWVDDDFDPVQNKRELVKICGHYVISTPEFLGIKNKFSYIEDAIKKRMMHKLQRLHGQ